MEDRKASATGAFDCSSDVAKVAAALESWDSGGKDTVAGVLLDLSEAVAVEPLRQLNLFASVVTLLRSSLGEDALAALFKDVFVKINEKNDPEVLASTVIDSIEEVVQWEKETKDRKKEQTNSAVLDRALHLLKELAVLPLYVVNLITSVDNLLPLGLHPTPRDSQQLQRGLIKLTTSTYFKQRTSNLLREASEGFSNLIVLLIGPMVFSTNLTESDEDTRERADKVWTRIQHIIGTFGLAPIRVLDLIIEIASCHVPTTWRFFRHLLEHFAQNGPRPLPHFDTEEERITHSMDATPDDDSTIAKALGFRFIFYQDTANGETPVGLLVLTALLIKEGLVKPAHILQKLSPDAAGMEDILSRYKSAMNTRSGPSNALANSVLVDDDAPEGGVSAAEEVVEPPKPKAEQKIQLLRALLAIGESNMSLYLLAKYPWTVVANPALGQLIIRNIDYSLTPLYRRLVRGPGYSEVEVAKPEEVVETLATPVPPSTINKEFEFFYPSWMDELEIWSDVDDIHLRGERWLVLLQGLGGRNSALMIKIIRLMKQELTNQLSEKANSAGWEEQDGKNLKLSLSDIKAWTGILRKVILPALSVSDAASGAFDAELQDLLRMLDWDLLCSLFGEWRDSTTNARDRNNLPLAVHAATQAQRDAKAAMRRITAAAANSSVPPSQAAERGPARELAGIAHSNPLAFWTIANSQTMSYGSVGNIGEHMVEVGRYTNKLSKDIAVFSWVDTLGNVSQLSSKAVDYLATFVGLVNRRFIFPLEPILNMIATQLKFTNMAAFTVLEKLMNGMTGEDTIEEFAISNDQLEAYAAGPEMLREAFFTSEITNGERKPLRSRELLNQVKQSGPRFVQALRSTGLAVPILIGLAYTAAEAPFLDSDAPLPAIQSQRDYARNMFVRFCIYVSSVLNPQERAELIPTFTEMSEEIGIEPQMAWMILRPKLDALAAAPAETTMDVDGQAGWWPPYLAETIGELENIPEYRPVKDVLGILAAHDITFSTGVYDKSHAHISKLLRELSKGRSESTAEASRLRARDRVLQAEKAEKEKHVQAVRDQLKDESRHWFSSALGRQREGMPPVEGLIARQLFDHCFFSRAVQTPADAMYVARFIRLTHDFGTPGFSTALAYNIFFSTTLSTRIYTCTENEARNLGRCLFLMMGDLDAWYLSESKYNEEALGIRDGSKATLPGMEFRTKHEDAKGHMGHESFKDFYAKLHNNLSASLKTCLVSNTEFSPKNAIVIALQLLPYFPVMDTNAKSIEDSVRNLVDGKLEKKIGPEQVPAFKSYLNQLKTRSAQRPYVSPPDFHPLGAKALARLQQQRALAEKKAKEKAAAEAAEAAAKAPPPEPVKEVEADPVKEQSPPVVEGASTTAQNDAKALREKLERNRSARAAAAESKTNDTEKVVTSEDTERKDDGKSRDVMEVKDKEKATMPPPEKPEKPVDEKSIEDERKRSRARRFGGLVEQVPTSPADRSPRAGGSRGSTPVPPRPQRSGTEESRSSERSRRREDDRERGSERDRRHERDDRDERRSERSHRRERGERSERSDRSDRSERGDRSERSERERERPRHRREERREEHDRPRREEPAPREERRDESRRSRRTSPAREVREHGLPAKPVVSRSRSPRRPERREEPIREREHREREPRAPDVRGAEGRGLDSRPPAEPRAAEREKPPTPRGERPPAAPRGEARPADRETPRQAEPPRHAERDTPRQPEAPRHAEREARPTPDRPERDAPRELRINSRARDSPANAGGSLAARMGLAVAENGSAPGTPRTPRSPNRKRPFDEDGGKDSPDPKRKRGGERERGGERNERGGERNEGGERERRGEGRGDGRDGRDEGNGGGRRDRGGSGRRRRGEGGGRLLAGAMRAASGHN